ncbi:MAG: alpha/beta hydrolase [Clostridia bacterium]|nr:alpha/beta hydrolase [Clostridia bacterium]
MSNEIMIWSEEEILKNPSKKDVWLHEFCIGGGSPVSIVCPGGGYSFVSHSNEGDPFAQYLNDRGHSAFVLNYSVGEVNAHYPAPMEDMAKAIEYVKKNAEKYNINADKITIWGSSAAGHLCSCFSAEYKSFEKDIPLRPFAQVLIYPVVNLDVETHGGSMRNLLGMNSTREERLSHSADIIATEDYPPAFIMHCEDDGCVPVSNSIRLHNTLDSLGVKNELHIYPAGGHGIGLGARPSAEGWIVKAVDFIESI